jgi:hypothetical protein
MCRCPLVLHEQTVRLGLANRKLAGSATRIAVSSESTLPLLPEAVRGAAVVTGNPVRPEVLAGHPDKATESLGVRHFDRRLPTVYVTGGAQGSQQINGVVRESPQASSETPHRYRTAGRDGGAGTGSRGGRMRRTGGDVGNSAVVGTGAAVVVSEVCGAGRHPPHPVGRDPAAADFDEISPGRAQGSPPSGWSLRAPARRRGQCESLPGWHGP